MEKSNDLTALVKVAEGIDGDTQAAGPEGVQAQQQVTEKDALMEKNVSGVMMILDLAGPAFAMVGFSSVGTTLAKAPEKDGPTAKQLLAMAWAPVLTKHDINISDVLTKYGEEFAAVAVTFPIAAAIFAGIKHDIAVRDAAAKAPGGAAQVTNAAAPAAAAVKSEYPQATLVQ